MKSSVYYFSGTGNSYAIAKGIEKKIENTTIYSIAECRKEKVCDDSDFVGFIFPVYFLNTPEIVMKLLKTIKIKNDAFVYCVANANGLPGKSLKSADRALKKSGRAFDALYYFDMPGNSVVFYDFSNSQPIRDYRLEMADHHIDYIVRLVKDKIKYRDNVIGSSPYIKAVFDRLSLKYLAKDYFFKTDDHCTLCGACIKSCPLDNITIKNNEVKWNRNCVHCWGCLNRCPNGAIQNIATEGKPRYVNPVVREKRI